VVSQRFSQEVAEASTQQPDVSQGDAAQLDLTFEAVSRVGRGGYLPQPLPCFAEPKDWIQHRRPCSQSPQMGIFQRRDAGWILNTPLDTSSFPYLFWF
jgi:hypothetical protein